MSNPTTPFGWQMPTATDLVTDLPADFEVFGQAVATSMADLLGGTTGQILSKTSNTDMDFTWVAPTTGDITGVTAGTGISGGGTSGDVTITNSMATAMTTSGDLIQATGSGTFARLGTGTNGQYLTTNGTTNSWGTISAGGMTLLSTTTLSGASVTISSISGSYKSLVLYIRNFLPASDNQELKMRINGDTSLHYVNYPYNTANGTLDGFDNQTSLFLTTGVDNASSQGFTFVELWDYTNTTSWKTGNVLSLGNHPTTAGGAKNFTGLIGMNQTAAITSLTFFSATGNLTSGTVLLYGVS